MTKTKVEKYLCSYFKDDHGRVIRVARHSETGVVMLHILHEVSTKNRTEKIWVKLEQLEDREVYSSEPRSHIEGFNLDEMKQLARNCPLRQT